MNQFTLNQRIELDSTKKTPYVLFDAQHGIIELKGSSIMQDCYAFYQPLLEWITQYTLEPVDTTVNIELEYFNSASAKILLIFFKMLSKIQKTGCMLNITWAFEEDDEGIRESGLDFSKLAKVEFNFISLA